MTQPTGDALAMIAQLQQEAADLRRQLAECKKNAWRHANLYLDANAKMRGQLVAVQREEIADLYTAYAYATAGSEVHARFPQVGRWLGLLPDIDTTSRETGEGDTR